MSSRRDFLKIGVAAGAAFCAGSAASCASPSAGAPAAASEGQGRLQVAGYPFDRVRGLGDGRVGIDGYDTEFVRADIYKLNGTAMGGAQTFEVQEIGLHPYMLAFANDGFRDYTLIPVFPLRTFRHKSIFVRTDRGIEKPEDLRGKTVAVAGYSQSSLTWIRGFLQHEYGVHARDLKWIVSQKSSDKGNVSKNESLLPEGIPVSKGPEGRDESELLVRGDVDAVLSAKEPQAYIDGDPRVARLFADYRSVERDYYKRTGIFPIMHAVAVRKDAIEKDPGLPRAAFEAYSRAKAANYKFMKDLGWAMISLPWFAQELEETRALMGENFWPYGIAENRAALEALFQYSNEQGLSKRRLTIEELFHPSTLELQEPA